MFVNSKPFSNGSDLKPIKSVLFLPYKSVTMLIRLLNNPKSAPTFVLVVFSQRNLSFGGLVTEITGSVCPGRIIALPFAPTT